MDQREKKRIKYEERTAPFKEEMFKYKFGECHECKKLSKLVSKNKVHILTDYAYWCSRGLDVYKEELKRSSYVCYTCDRRRNKKGLFGVKDAQDLFLKSRFCQKCYSGRGVTFYLKQGEETPLLPLTQFEFWSEKGESNYTREIKKFEILCSSCKKCEKGVVDYKELVWGRMNQLKTCRCGFCYPVKELTKENLYVKVGKREISAYFGSEGFDEILKKANFITKSCFEEGKKRDFERKQAENALLQGGLSQHQKEIAEEVIKEIETKEKLHYDWLNDENTGEFSSYDSP